MDTKTETIFIDNLGMTANIITDDQVHEIYNGLAEVDKVSTDNLAAAEGITEASDYTSKDNNVIEASELIPGVDVIPSNIVDTVEESEDNLKSAFDAYDLDDESVIQMLKVIDEYKAGNTSSLYSRLPKQMQYMVNGIVASESNNINPKQIMSLRNNAAKMLVDSFINDAKMSAVVEEFNTEISSTMNEMNEEYDKMLNDAIDSVFNRIEEIRTNDPEHAEKIESVKHAFNSATTFEKQLEYAKHTSYNKFNKLLARYKDDVYYFNKRVNSNSFGVKITNIEEIVPVIKLALPQYTEEDIKKFVICICRTIGDIDDLANIAYEYRMVGNIYKYKFTPIDSNGEIIFKNISKVIDAILS